VVALAEGFATEEPQLVALFNLRWIVIELVLDNAVHESVMLAGEVWTVAFKRTAARSELLCAMAKEATMLKKRVRRLRAILFQVGERSDLPSSFPLCSGGQAVRIGTKNKNGSVGPFIEKVCTKVTWDR